MSSGSFGSPPSACKHAGMLDPLATNRVVLVDGGMGTELEARGARMDNEAWSGLANLEEPGLVREIHEDYIRAGADLVIANTFPANRAALAAGGFGDRVEEVNRAAVAAAVEARCVPPARPAGRSRGRDAARRPTARRTSRGG